MNEMVADAVDMPASAPASAPASVPQHETPVADNGGDQNGKSPREQPRDMDRPQYSEGDPRAELDNPVTLKELRETVAPEIDPPRSWTKEDREYFKTLPRETQERIAEREKNTERTISTRFNEAAKVKRQAEQTLQEYEAKLPLNLAMMQSAFLGEFADIKSWQDIENMAATDQARFAKFQIAKDKIASVQQEVAQAEQRATAEYQQRLAEHANKQSEQRQAEEKADAQWREQQDELAAERIPDLRDPVKVEQAEKRVMNYLTKDIGIPVARVVELWNEDRTFRSAEGQRIVHDAAMWNEAQARAKAAVPKAPPMPQRPGVSNGGGPSNDFEAMKSAADRGDMHTFIKLSNASARKAHG